MAIGAKAVPLLIENLKGHDLDLQILSLNVLQWVGDKSAAIAVRKLINSQPRDANVRFAAYETLAEISDRSGDYVLAGGLTDLDSNVRIAAARAIDCTLGEVLVAGIRNLAGQSKETASQVSRAVVDAQAGNLFMSLIDEQQFQDSALTYLGESAHREIREFFIKILIKNEQ